MKKPELKALSLLLGSVLLASCAHNPAPPGPDKQSKLFEVRVKKGDTLRNMVQQFAVSDATIQSINGLDASSELKPGQVLYIPVSEKALMSPDLRGRSRLVTSVLPVSTGQVSDGDNPIKGERAALYTDMRQLEWPIDGRVSSVFGPRHGRTHQGIDIMAPLGHKIKAAHAGTVEYAGWKSGYGWTVVVRQRSFKTLYAHCSKLFVKSKQSVTKGQHIAQVGDSGNAEGTHLHFEYKNLADRSLDPMPHFARQYAH